MFAKAIVDDPNETSGYLSRAPLRAGLYDYKSAIADLSTVIDFAADPDTYLKRARAWPALNEDANAAADLEAALALDPSNAAATEQLALVRLGGGDGEAALAMVDARIEEGGSERFGWMASKEEILNLSQKAAEAIAVISELIAEKPGDPRLLNTLCWTKATANIALDSGLKDCTKAVELAHRDASILDSRALVYFRLSRLDEALDDLDAALAIDPNLALSLYMRCIVRRRMRQAAVTDADLAGARIIDLQIDRNYACFGIKP